MTGVQTCALPIYPNAIKLLEANPDKIDWSNLSKNPNAIKLLTKKKAEESGFDQDWIKAEWAETNRYANEVGTAVHEWIEYYFKEEWQPLPTNPDIIHRINKFNHIFAKQLYKLEPLKFELKVFSKKWKKAGTIDSLFIKDGKLFILDWKTNKKFTDDGHKDGRWQKQSDNTMKYLLIILTLLTVGCSTTVPVKAKFPDPPGKLMTERCPQLKTLADDSKLSDVSKTITMNYTEYYICAVKVDSWIEWYDSQKKIFESVK